MALTDARVKFLRGTLANLPTAKTDGNIYITTDERGMYVDYKDTNNTLQRIRIGDLLEFPNWAAIEAQAATGAYSTSALYYAQSENILGKWNGTSWTQINAPTQFSQIVSDMGYNITVGSGTTATIKLNVRDGSNVPQYEDALTYKLVSADANVLRLTSSTDGQNPSHPVIQMRVKDLQSNFEAGTDASAYSDDSVALNFYSYETGTDASGTVVTKPASLTPASTIQLNADNTGFVHVKATNAGVITVGAKLTFAQAFDSSGVLTTTVTDDFSNISVASYNVTPTISYGKAGAKTSAVFANGVANLDVYTIAQVDTEITNKLKAVNAMVFKGSLGSAGDGGIVSQLPLGTEEVQIGDTYKVVTPGTYIANTQTPPTTYSAIVGDMFIATSSDGTEETNGYITPSKIRWVYIPSGNDEGATFTMQYDSTLSKLMLTSSGVQVGAALAIGDGLTATSAGAGSNQVITVSHNTYAAITPASDATAARNIGDTGNEYGSATFTAITGITTENGHITDIKTGAFTVELKTPIKQVNMNGGLVALSGNAITPSASATSSRAAITSTMVLADNTDVSGSMNISSNTLTFRKASATSDLTVDMLWETF